MKKKPDAGYPADGIQALPPVLPVSVSSVLVNTVQVEYSRLLNSIYTIQPVPHYLCWSGLTKVLTLLSTFNSRVLSNILNCNMLVRLFYLTIYIIYIYVYNNRVSFFYSISTLKNIHTLEISQMGIEARVKGWTRHSCFKIQHY